MKCCIWPEYTECFQMARDRLQWRNIVNTLLVFKIVNHQTLIIQITPNKMQSSLIYLFLQTLYMFQAVSPHHQEHMYTQAVCTGVCS